MYYPRAETNVSADASSFRLGAVLLQKFGEWWKPIVYACHSMTETEGRYAQVEKEALAVTWACENFSTYILGKKTVIETNNRPLVSLLGGKYCDKLPPRILRFYLQMSRFDFSIIHVPRKLLYTADTLSRAPTSVPDYDSQSLQEEAEAVMEVCISQLAVSKSRLEVYSNLKALIQYAKE